MPFLTTPDNVSLHYRLEGSGEPLLLLAGMISDIASWEPVRVALTKHYQLILLDNRGTGQSQMEALSISRELMIADAIALLDHLAIEQVAILGHSMGGMVGWSLAAEIPTRVRCLISAAGYPKLTNYRIELFNTLARLRRNDNEADWHRLLYQFLFSPAFFDNSPAVDAAIMASMNYKHRQSYQSYKQQAAALHSFTEAPDFSRIQCPVTMITASRDLMTDQSIDDVQNSLPTLQHHTIEAAHALHWENPVAFNRIVLQCLAEHHTQQA